MSQPDYQRLAEFRYLLRRFVIFSENAAVATGVTAQQHQALLAVKGFTDGAVTTGALAERLGIRHHSTVGLVDRLVAKKLFQRRRDPHDRRQVLIELTPKAEMLLEQLSAAHQDELRRLAPLLRDLLADLTKPDASRSRSTR